MSEVTGSKCGGVAELALTGNGERADLGEIVAGDVDDDRTVKRCDCGNEGSGGTAITRFDGGDWFGDSEKPEDPIEDHDQAKELHRVRFGHHRKDPFVLMEGLSAR